MIINMQPLRLPTLSLYIILCFFSSLSKADEKPVVELTHWWVSPGELKALSVLDRAITNRNGIFEPSVLKNFNEHRALIIERISLGYMPATTHWLGGNELLELKKLGILNSLPEYVGEMEIKDILFDEVLEEVTVNGELAALPVGIHIWNTTYYNARIYDELKLLLPNDWNSLIAQARIIKQAGYTPFAIGNEPWQLGFLLDAILLSKGGYEKFNSIFDAENFKLELVRDLLINTFESLYELRDLTSSEYNNNTWNENTSLVGKGEAAIQIMGDFAKGELLADGKIPGLDFYCSMTPGTSQYFYYGVDVFALLKVKEPVLKAGQSLLVETVLDADIQAQYISHKGGLPVRNDVDIFSLDTCAGKMYSSWVNDTDNIRIPLPAGHSRLRMTAVQNAGSEVWNGNGKNIEIVTDRLINTLETTIK